MLQKLLNGVALSLLQQKRACVQLCVVACTRGAGGAAVQSEIFDGVGMPRFPRINNSAEKGEREKCVGQ